MRRRKNGSCGICVFAAVMIFLGLILLCCFSYKFLLFLTAAAFIIIGMILMKRC